MNVGVRDENSAGFTGKVVLVTGAASGLGRAIAVAFAGAGSNLVVVDVDEVGLKETAGMVDAAGGSCMRQRVDVSNREQMEGMAEAVLREFGRVDILVNNAGVAVGGELKDIPIEDIEWIVGVNLMGEIYGTRLFLPGMVERGRGHIVNVSSLSGLAVLPLHIPYTTTKFGITGFTEALWIEAGRYGVGVTLVCPGAINTAIMSKARLHAPDAVRERVEGLWTSRLEKKGSDPEEVARRVLQAVQRNRFLLITGFESHLLYNLRRLFPGLNRRLVAAVTRLMSRGV